MHDGINPFYTMLPINGYVKVEQAPFAPAIARCHSFKHNLPQKLDLEVVAVVAS